MKRLLILKLGSTFPDLARTHGDFEDWIARGLRLPAERIAVADAQSSDGLPAPHDFCGVVLTGSHSMVTEAEPWSEKASDWVAGAVEAAVPLVGICYGHQLLARALGGEVDYNPRGDEYGTVEVLVKEESASDRLFGGLSSRLSVQVCHAQSVRRLPPGARVLAGNAHDSCQAFAVGRAAWGVQFHPEFDARAMRAYIQDASAELGAAGKDPADLLRRVAETPEAESLLARFGRLATETHATP